jgi:phosphate-selective porin OprO/OprP
MKKLKLTFYILLAFLSFQTYAQDNEWEIKHTSSGNFNISSKDGNYRFTPGGRFTFDGALFNEDITSLANGTTIKEARLSSSFKIKKFNVFVEFDFAKSRVRMKDITLRYNFTDHSFLKAGHYTEPFSANFITTTEKVPFIGRPATVSAFAPGRNLGITYRHYQKYFWFEGGVFGDDVNQTYKGKDGYAFTGRLVLIPIDIPNSHLHFGISASYRTGDDRGLDDEGSGKWNRKLGFTAGLQNSIHTDRFIEAFVGPSGTDSYGQNDLEDLENGGAKDQTQFSFEIMDIYKKFYWQAELITTRVTRELNKEKILFFERDGGVFPETWDDISYKYGEARPVNFYGYYVQASYLLFGGNFKYNRYNSTITRQKKQSLQISARYNFTSLNDIEGEYINGDFFTEKGKNLSFAGGETSAFTLALNYVHNANVRFLMEYTNQKIDNYIEPDETIGIFQARLQVLF